MVQKSPPGRIALPCTLLHEVRKTSLSVIRVRRGNPAEQKSYLYQETIMKKRDIFEGIIEGMDFPDKGWLYMEDRKVTVK